MPTVDDGDGRMNSDQAQAATAQLSQSWAETLRAWQKAMRVQEYDHLPAIMALLKAQIMERPVDVAQAMCAPGALQGMLQALREALDLPVHGMASIPRMREHAAVILSMLLSNSLGSQGKNLHINLRIIL